jgi:hypothetical protein
MLAGMDTARTISGPGTLKRKDRPGARDPLRSAGGLLAFAPRFWRRRPGAAGSSTSLSHFQNSSHHGVAIAPAFAIKRARSTRHRNRLFDPEGQAPLQARSRRSSTRR